MAYDALYWRDELKRYEEESRKFVEAGKKIIKRFRDERKESDNYESRFNILWSNVKTLKPAIYSRPPKVEVSRRFKDQNDVARVASMILERSIDFELKHYTDYHSSLSACVDDRLLPGRGVAWIRYEPKTEEVEEPSISEDSEIGEEYNKETNGLAGEEPLERIVEERTIVDYVYWQDFAHLPCRTWEEVTWVGRRVYMSAEEGKERFGSDFADVPLTHSPDEKGDEKSSTKELKKAEVWEIWCKSSGKVYWIAANYEKLLDERDDPLELENFFPCPKPLFATMTTDNLVPVADFKLYQDQADEIDEITSRIKHLTKALKVMGVYAADEPSLSRLMKEGQDSVLIPVTNWPAFVEKGGIQGAIQLVPLNELVKALQQLYMSRESCKQMIYETTGLSDIIRGASQASETATAQQIKSQYASIRLNEMKDDVARFARDLLRMKAEIICSKYQPETILMMSGIANTPDGQQFAPQAIAMLKNEPLRNFAVEIDTDTLVQLDEQGEKQARVEFLTAAGGFLKEAVMAGQQAPQMTPLLLQMLLFGVRGFKVGRELEGSFEQLETQLKQQQQHPQQQQPDPAAMQAQQDAQQAAQKAQMDMQVEQGKMQLEQMKMQQEAQAKQMEMQQAAQLAQQKQVFEEWKAKLDAETKIAVAQISADNSMRLKSMEQSVEAASAEKNEAKQSSVLQSLLDQSNANMQKLLLAHSQGQSAIVNTMANQLNRPRQVIRDVNGKIQGVE